MAKNKKSKETKISPMVDVYKPPTCLNVSKEQAASVSVGDNISVTVKGKVSSVSTQENYGNENKKESSYRIELKNSEVAEISHNKADGAMKKMMEKE